MVGYIHIWGWRGPVTPPKKTRTGRPWSCFGFVGWASGYCIWILKESMLEDLGVPMLHLQQSVFHYCSVSLIIRIITLYLNDHFLFFKNCHLCAVQNTFPFLLLLYFLKRHIEQQIAWDPEEVNVYMGLDKCYTTRCLNINSARKKIWSRSGFNSSESKCLLVWSLQDCISIR